MSCLQNAVTTNCKNQPHPHLIRAKPAQLCTTSPACPVLCVLLQAYSYCSHMLSFAAFRFFFHCRLRGPWKWLVTTAARVLAAHYWPWHCLLLGLIWPFHAEMAAVKLRVLGSLCWALAERSIGATTRILQTEAWQGPAEKPTQVFHSLSPQVGSSPSGDPVLTGQSEQGTHSPHCQHPGSTCLPSR